MAASGILVPQLCELGAGRLCYAGGRHGGHQHRDWRRITRQPCEEGSQRLDSDHSHSVKRLGLQRHQLAPAGGTASEQCNTIFRPVDNRDRRDKARGATRRHHDEAHNPVSKEQAV